MEDGEIIELFAKRSDQAIEELKQKYGAHCYTVAYNILRNRQDAEEVVNDAYLIIWNNIPPHIPKNLCGYLCVTARNVSLARLREETRQKRGGVAVTLSASDLADYIPGAENVEEEVYARQLSFAVNRFLHSLKDDARRIFICRYFAEMQIKDIAEKYGFSQGKVKVTLARTKEKLKDYLIKEGFYE